MNRDSKMYKFVTACLAIVAHVGFLLIAIGIAVYEFFKGIIKKVR